MRTASAGVEDVLNQCLRLASAGQDPEHLLHRRPDVAEDVRPLLARALRGLCELFWDWSANSLPMPGDGEALGKGLNRESRRPRVRVHRGADGRVELCIVLAIEGGNGN